MTNIARFGLPMVWGVTAVGLACLPVQPGHAASAAARATAAWRSDVAKTRPAGAGCFKASFPSLSWQKVACGQAPKRPFLPKGSGGGRAGFTVGNGDDYVAQVQKPLTAVTASFPRAHLIAETGINGPNSYSLQLNSQFFYNSPACSGAADPSQCQAWEQFIYSSDETAIFIQYWLINYSATCPNGWYSYQSDCYTNSDATTVDQLPITDLTGIQFSGATDGTNDTVTLTFDGNAYSAGGTASMLDLHTFWTEAEFNVFGDGDGSEADFTAGTQLKVQLLLSTTSKARPVCLSGPDVGTTGETNNLNLRVCAARGGTNPEMQFLENNKASG